jgi:hypothetical protein
VVTNGCRKHVFFLLQGHRDSGEHAHKWEHAVGNRPLGGFGAGARKFALPDQIFFKQK